MIEGRIIGRNSVGKNSGRYNDDRRQRLEKSTKSTNRTGNRSNLNLAKVMLIKIEEW